MFGTIGRDVMADRLAGSERVKDACRILAAIEVRQLRAADNLADAADLELSLSIPSEDERADALLDVVQALLAGEFEQWWREEMVGDLLNSTPPERLVGCGKDSDEWSQQVADWAAELRDRGAEGEDRELADVACQEVYGIPLGEFEAEVVEWSEKEEVQHLITGNLTTVRKVMEQATAELSTRDE